MSDLRADRTPEGDGGGRRWPRRAVAVSNVLAVLAVVAIVAGVALGSVPVENPHVQRCGVPWVFVATGRTDVYADPGNPPKGLTPARAAAANRNRCQERVALRVIPAGGLVLGGLLVGLGGLGLLLAGRVARRRDITAARAAAEAAGARAGPLPAT